MGQEGCWLAEMAEACDVHRSTFDVWCEEHPEFLEALNRAKQASQKWFESVGREGLFMDRFNANLWQKQMQARFREEYTESRRVEGGISVTVSTGVPE